MEIRGDFVGQRCVRAPDFFLGGSSNGKVPKCALNQRRSFRVRYQAPTARLRRIEVAIELKPIMSSTRAASDALFETFGGVSPFFDETGDSRF